METFAKLYGTIAGTLIGEVSIIVIITLPITLGLIYVFIKNKIKIKKP
jgi:hypothetical protein